MTPLSFVHICSIIRGRVSESLDGEEMEGVFVFVKRLGKKEVHKCMRVIIIKNQTNFLQFWSWEAKQEAANSLQR